MDPMSYVVREVVQGFDVLYAVLHGPSVVCWCPARADAERIAEALEAADAPMPAEQSA